MTTFRQQLPGLNDYRPSLVQQGASFPLPVVRFNSTGLLSDLPAPPAGGSGWPWDREYLAAAKRGSWPKITIVMPSYGQGQYLEAAIRSVLLQNYPSLEFIVMDGGSTDESPHIIEKYRRHLSYAQSRRDRGQSHAINLGFSVASGEVFAWLNSDDLYLPGALYRVAEAYQDGAEVVYGDGLEIHQHNGKINYVTAQHADARYTRFPGLLMQPATFWSAVAHQTVWEEQTCALDYELWIRLLPGRRLRYIAAPLAAARQHESAKTFSPSMKRRWEEDAARNGLAHPELYGHSWQHRLLRSEYRFVQRMSRAWRSRHAERRLQSALSECGWQPRHT